MCSLPRLFLERVQNVYAVAEFGDVDHSMLQGCSNPNLPNTWPDAAHRLPVIRVQSSLNHPQLKPRVLPRIDRKGPNVISRTTEPDQGFVRHNSIYKYQHV